MSETEEPQHAKPLVEVEIGSAEQIGERGILHGDNQYLPGEKRMVTKSDAAYFEANGWLAGQEPKRTSAMVNPVNIASDSAS